MEVLQQKCTDRSQETPNLSSGWKNVQKRRRLTCSLSFTDLRQASLVQHRAKSGQKSQGFTSDSHTFPKDKIQLHLKLVKDICRYCHSCRLKNTMSITIMMMMVKQNQMVFAGESYRGQASQGEQLRRWQQGEGRRWGCWNVKTIFQIFALNFARGTTDPGYWVHNSNHPNSRSMLSQHCWHGLHPLTS